MNWLVTHPGKLGDLAWALATTKALAAQAPGGKVDFLTSPYCQSLVPLLCEQPYLDNVMVHPHWHQTGDCPGIQPWCPPEHPHLGGKSKVIHLGLRGWPEPNLFFYYAQLVSREYGLEVKLRPEEPWLSAGEGDGRHTGWFGVAFTDEWAEVKAGHTVALATAFPRWSLCRLLHEGSRYHREFDFHGSANVFDSPVDVWSLARSIRRLSFLVSCKSLAYVLACGLGTPVVVAEPSHHRWQAIFDHPGSRNIVQNHLDCRPVVQAVKDMIGRLGL